MSLAAILSALKYGAIAAIVIALLGACATGYHFLKQNWQLQADKQLLSGQIAAQKTENDKEMAAIVSEKNGAIQRATTIAKQLEVLKHAKVNPADDSLIAAAQWVQLQPDPYHEVQSTSGTDPGHAPACGVLSQVTIAEYLTNQFAALEECRGKLFELRKLNAGK